MGCKPPSFIILTASEWNEWAKYNKQKTGRNRFRAASTYLGICSPTKGAFDPDGGAIAIFLKRFSSLERVDSTIRHELVHWIRTTPHYTERFNELMKLMKDGKLKA
jgi:hypothetical protein